MKKSSPYTIFTLGLTFILVCSTFIFFEFTEFSESSLRILIRWSAKISVSFFVLAFSASSLHALFSNKGTVFMVKTRPFIGLSFGIFHSFHLFNLWMLQDQFHPVFELAKISSLVGGGLAYLFMYLMMLTTFPAIKKRLTQNQWTNLHLMGSYWIWIIFTRTYSKKVFQWNEEYFLFSLLLFAVLLRAIVFFLKRYSKKKSLSG